LQEFPVNISISERMARAHTCQGSNVRSNENGRGRWKAVSAEPRAIRQESGTVRARMKKETPEKDWKPWTFPV
jgi:hypothetical protein